MQQQVPLDLPIEQVLLADEKEVTVLVTGYGPFLDLFPINSSWSIASTLPTYLPATSENPTSIRIVVPANPLKVAYQPVINKVPKLLASEDPSYDIILHIGLAAARNYYTLEQQSVRDGYLQKDVDDAYFSQRDAARLFSECPAVLKPTFDCADVWRRWRGNVSDDVGADIRTSDDPGSYLCGFLYYLSMSWFWKQGREERPVVFLHVPDLPNEIDIDQGRLVAIGLIRALVESRKKVGIHDSLKGFAKNSGEGKGGVAGAKGKDGEHWDGIH